MATNVQKHFSKEKYIHPEATDQENLLSIYTAVRQGFTLRYAKALLSTSPLCVSEQILEKVIGRSYRKKTKKKNIRLNAQQSAVVLQYARMIEIAISVFGSQEIAELWLARPCKYLNGIIPIEAAQNYFGYLAVANYLENIKRGVYQ